MTAVDTRVRDAAVARDEGMTQAENAADPRRIIMIDDAIAEANASGEPWSANTIRDRLPVVCSGLVGARVHAAALRRPQEMVRVGMVRSTLVSTKRAWIAQWRGVTS